MRALGCVDYGNLIVHSFMIMSVKSIQSKNLEEAPIWA